MKKLICLLLLFFVFIVNGCSKGFEFTGYESIVVRKNYVLDTNIFEEVVLNDTEKEEVFDLVNHLQIKERKDVSLDIKGYIYQIIIDEKVISFVNGEYVYCEDNLYQITSGANELILYFESK